MTHSAYTMTHSAYAMTHSAYTITHSAYTVTHSSIAMAVDRFNRKYDCSIRVIRYLFSISEKRNKTFRKAWLHHWLHNRDYICYTIIYAYIVILIITMQQEVYDGTVNKSIKSSY